MKKPEVGYFNETKGSEDSVFRIRVGEAAGAPAMLHWRLIK